MKKVIIQLLLLLPLLVTAQKKEIEVNAKIREVIVYPSAAEINYEKKITVPKGKTTFVFTDLPLFIVENSVNLSISEPTVSIVTLTEQFNYVKEKRNPGSIIVAIQDSLVKLRKQKGILTCKRETVEAEKDLLFRGESIGGLAQGVKVSEMEKASAFFSKRYFELNKQLYELKERELEIEEKQQRYQNQLKEVTTVIQRTTSEISVLVNSQSEKEAIFTLRFLTPKAGWAPLYDFKYNGPQEPIQFVFRANVFNACGVNWDDVKIKLSTADPIKGFALPDMNKENGKTTTISGVQFKQVEIVNAITEYKIEHQYNFPSDAKPYLVEVEAYTMPASFNYLLIPKLDPFGFLMARVPNWNKYNLIPGTANIYNSGTYMGKTFLDTYADDDTLNLFLGKDKRIQSYRAENTIVRKRYVVGNFITEETKIELNYKNNSADALSVEVIDQVPIMEEEDEKMTFNGIGKALYEKEEGKLTWKYTIKPNETISLDYKYDIRYPKTGGDPYRQKKRKFRTISCPAF
jgi:hypothetical protein